MKDGKTFKFGPPDQAPISKLIEALKEERKNKPYVVTKDPGGNNSVWERIDNGRVVCVHNDLWTGGVGRESDENTVVTHALISKCEVYYCDKKEVFMICL